MHLSTAKIEKVYIYCVALTCVVSSLSQIYSDFEGIINLKLTLHELFGK
jgi:hypothetical protein